MATKNKLEQVVRLDWEESEKGWGVRPDGCSLHLTTRDCKNFVKEYWARMPEETPDEYSRPSGEPFQAYVDKQTYEQIKKSKNGIRRY